MHKKNNIKAGFDPKKAKHKLAKLMKRAAKKQKTGKVSKKPRTTAIVVRGINPQPVIGKTFAPELKSMDNFATNLPIPSGSLAAGHTSLLNCVRLGNDRYQRIGRKVQLKSIHIKLSLYPPEPTVNTLPQDICFVLVWDQDATAAPALSDLFQETSPAGASGSSVISHINVDKSKVYKVLARKIIPLRHCGTATGVIPCNGNAFQANQDDIYWSWNVKCDLLTVFNGTNGGTIADIETGALWLGYWSNCAASDDVATFNVSARIRYYD